MDLDKYSARLRADLVAAAALGDDATKTTAAALAAAAENSARLMLLAALSEAADEVTAALGDRTVRISLRDSVAVIDVHPNGGARAGFDPPAEDLPGDIRRVTLRLVDQMKERAEAAAAQSGQSLNSWVADAVQGALRNQWTAQWGRPHTPGRPAPEAPKPDREPPE